MTLPHLGWCPAQPEADAPPVRRHVMFALAALVLTVLIVAYYCGIFLYVSLDTIHRLFH